MFLKRTVEFIKDQFCCVCEEYIKKNKKHPDNLVIGKKEGKKHVYCHLTCVQQVKNAKELTLHICPQIVNTLSSQQQRLLEPFVNTDSETDWDIT
jgi:hypothetical protein